MIARPKLVKACGRCRFYTPQEKYPGGTCWRYPPTAHAVTDANGQTGWTNERPYVSDDEGCGEWKVS